MKILIPADATPTAVAYGFRVICHACDDIVRVPARPGKCHCACKQLQLHRTDRDVLNIRGREGWSIK